MDSLFPYHFRAGVRPTLRRLSKFIFIQSVHLAAYTATVTATILAVWKAMT